MREKKQPTPKTQPCFLCKKPTSEDNYCYGCKHYICDAHGDAPYGTHDSAEHEEEDED